MMKSFLNADCTTYSGLDDDREKQHASLTPKQIPLLYTQAGNINVNPAAHLIIDDMPGVWHCGVV